MSSKVLASTTLLLGLLAYIGWWKLSGRANESRSAATAPTTPTSDPDEPDQVWARMVRSGPMARPRDAFRVIDRPRFLTIDQAVDSMSDDEIVLGLTLAGEARAYPINYLNDHEMVRDQIANTPLLVTW